MNPILSHLHPSFRPLSSPEAGGVRSARTASAIVALFLIPFALDGVAKEGAPTPAPAPTGSKTVEKQGQASSGRASKSNAATPSASPRKAVRPVSKSPGGAADHRLADLPLEEATALAKSLTRTQKSRLLALCNEGSAEDLATAIPGLGPARAAALVAARPIRNLEDLLGVRGIGPSVYGNIIAHVDASSREGTAKLKPKPKAQTDMKPTAKPEATASPKSAGTSASSGTAPVSTSHTAKEGPAPKAEKRSSAATSKSSKPKSTPPKRPTRSAESDAHDDSVGGTRALPKSTGIASHSLGRVPRLGDGPVPVPVPVSCHAHSASKQSSSPCRPTDAARLL